jgi:hypothetical protein
VHSSGAPHAEIASMATPNAASFDLLILAPREQLMDASGVPPRQSCWSP